MKKIGVLGYGSIGKRHVANLEQLDCNVRVCDPAPIAVQNYERDSLLKWADAMVIASPTSEHWSDIVHCNRADKPMFVEKPVGHLMATASMANIKMIGYNLRMHSGVKKAKQWLNDGLIGKPLWANFTCAQANDKPAYLRDGVILNWSHEIDLALFLLGRAQVVSCTKDTDETIADISLRHPDGCITAIHLDYVTKPEIRAFVIGGQNGNIIVDLVRRSAMLQLQDRTTVYNGTDSFDENYLDEMRAFLMRLAGQPALGCTAQEGLDVLDICLRAKGMAR